MVDIGSFFTGAVFGFFTAYFLLAYLLLGHDLDTSAATTSIAASASCEEVTLNGGNSEKKVCSPEECHEKAPTATELKLLDDAMLALSGDHLTAEVKDISKQLGSDPNSNSNSSEPTTASDWGLTKNMVAKFTTFSAAAKDRQRHIKAFGAFLDELGKVHGHFGKALQKVSKQAEIHVAGKNAFLDKWWNSLAIALDHMSVDQLYVGSALCIEIKEGMVSVETEHDHLEKHIYGDGSKLLSKLRETNDIFAAKKKEFERVRDKIASTSTSTSTALFSTPTTAHVSSPSQSSPPPSISSLSPPTSSSSSSSSVTNSNANAHASTPINTPTPKSSKYEAALKEANEATTRLSACQKDFDEKMPRMLADYELMASNGQSSMMALLIKVTNLLTEIQLKSNQVTYAPCKKPCSHHSVNIPVDLYLLSIQPPLSFLMSALSCSALSVLFFYFLSPPFFSFSLPFFSFSLLAPPLFLSFSLPLSLLLSLGH
jgi:hypothetical protein